jgi:hypothetical protein
MFKSKRSLISLILLHLCILTLAQNAESLKVDTTRVLGAERTDSLTLAKSNFIVLSTTGGESFPLTKFLYDECPPVQDQGHIGSCVSYATAYDLCSILGRRENGNWNYSTDHLYSPLAMHPYIRGCNNNCERCGAQIGNALNYLHNRGIPTLAVYNPDPYDPRTCYLIPQGLQSSYWIKDYGYLFSYNLPIVSTYKTYSIKSELVQGNIVAIAITLDNAFTHGYAFNNPEGVWQNFQGGYAGGHAMLIVGYDESKQAFAVMNSWGSNWITNNNTTPHGFCWISYQIMDSYCLEAWVANTGQATVLGGQIFTATRDVATSAQDHEKKENQYNKEGGFYENGTYNHFFITNRYVQYHNVRFIPVNIDKTHNLATIAIYLVENGTPKLSSTFDIKIGETKEFEISNHRYSFKANDIKRYHNIGRLKVDYTISVTDKK